MCRTHAAAILDGFANRPLTVEDPLPLRNAVMNRGLLATLIPGAGVTRCDYVSEGPLVFPASSGEEEEGKLRKVTPGRHHASFQRRFV